MKHIAVALYAEIMKNRKSKILLITLLIFIFIPMMMGLMMFIARNPEMAAKLGLIGMKANMFGNNDWTGYFALLSQVIASLGLIGFGFVTTWVFGREHTDRTMKDLLALPVRRSSIVNAKFIVVFLFCLSLTLVLYISGIGLGLFMHLPGWSPENFFHFTESFFISGFLTLFLCSPVSFLAGYSQSIIAPLGFVIFTMIMAQFIGLIGLGPYFPWAIPGLYSVGNNSPGMQIKTSSYIILVLTFMLGYLATVRWWQSADHK